MDWKTPPGAAKERSLPELLSLVHVLLGPDLCPPQAVVANPLSLSSTPGEVYSLHHKYIVSFRLNKI